MSSNKIQSNHKGHLEEREIPLRTNENNQTAVSAGKRQQPNCRKRGKTRATKLWLALVLRLIGRESDASSLDQSQSEVKRNRCNPGLPWILSWYMYVWFSILLSGLSITPFLQCKNLTSRWTVTEIYLWMTLWLAAKVMEKSNFTAEPMSPDSTWMKLVCVDMKSSLLGVVILLTISFCYLDSKCLEPVNL